MQLQGSDEAAHLFNDSLYGDIFTEIDVKERLRTREQNAREDRAFQFQSRIIDRARDVQDRRMSHEQKMVRNLLYDIQARTANLKRTTPLSRASSMSSLTDTHAYHSNTLRAKGERWKQLRGSLSTECLPPIRRTSPRKPELLTNDFLADIKNNDHKGNSDGRVTGLSQKPKIVDRNYGSPAPRTRHLAKTGGRPHPPADETNDKSQFVDFIKYNTRHNIEKAAHISQSLDYLYKNRKKGGCVKHTVTTFPRALVKL